VSARETQSLNAVETKQLVENALQEIVQELNFPEPTTGDVKSKITTIRAVFAAELAKIINSERRGASLHDMYVPKLFWFKHTHSFLRCAFFFFFTTPESTEASK
jgi:hypothetical protein